jgi:hypothetical protein
MTNFFSRTRSDWILGAWAATPAVGMPLLVLYWWHRTTTAIASWDFAYVPVGTGTLLAFLVCGALYLVAIALVINDVWGRSMATARQVVWTVLTLFTAPYGGLIYWVICCRRD